MATNTARAGLRKPAVGDNIDVTLDLNNNWDKVDANLGAFQCTSGTRPTGSDRFTGQIIYESDTTRQFMWNGTEWMYMTESVWTHHTPTYTGFTLGNGSHFGKYQRLGKTVIYQGRFFMGSTSSVAGVFNLGLPVVSTALFEGQNIGTFACIDASGGTGAARTGCMQLDSTSDAVALVATGGVVNTTTPFTWATSDEFRWQCMYEVP